MSCNTPLEGVRVLEIGLFHAGPGAGAILGDLGAEVIKIELPEGDPERYWTRLGQLDLSLPGGEGAMFQASNRNKKSICLDINNPKGRKVFHGLIKTADVFLTNIRKSTKEKLGIDYATLEARAANSTKLVKYFDRVFAKKTRDEWMDIFLARGLMFCSIQHASEVKNDPQARANNYVVDFEDPSLGKIQIPGYPIHFSACTAGTRTLAPKLGEHTASVLKENGYAESEIKALMSAGAVF